MKQYKNHISYLLYRFRAYAYRGGLFLLPFLLACEKDDICVSGDTPLLIIRFYDKDNPTILKKVNLLRVTGDGVTAPLSSVNRVTVDSIAIPLRSFADSSTFSFISDSQDDLAGMETGNIDVVHISYQRREVFVSRACGFIMNYENLDVVVDNDVSNWIAFYEVRETAVTNQKQAHVAMFH